MAIGRPIPVLTLTDEERDALERWARRPTTAQALSQRARLVLTCARGRTNTQVARELHLTKQTVGKWRSRFLAARLDGLLDEPRPGGPRRITDSAVEQVVTLTGGETARGHPLEYPRNGRALWLEPEHGQSHLAGLRPAAAGYRRPLSTRHATATSHFTTTCMSPSMAKSRGTPTSMPDGKGWVRSSG